MITSDPDFGTDCQFNLLLQKLCSERAKERAEAVSGLRNICSESSLLKSPTNATALVAGMCSRLPIEVAASGNAMAGTAANGSNVAGGPGNATPKRAAQVDYHSKSLVAVRDCKWAVQGVLQATGGRLPADLVITIVEAIPSLLCDGEALGEYVSAVCNKLVFSCSVYVHCIKTELWGRVVGAVCKAFSGVNGRKALIHNEAELLILLNRLSANMPRPVLPNARKIFGVAFGSFKHSLEVGDFVVCSSAVDCILYLLRRSKAEGFILEMVKGIDFSDPSFVDWIRSRSIAQQTRCAEMISFLMEIKLLKVPLDSIKLILEEELKDGKLFSQLVGVNEYFTERKSAYFELLRFVAQIFEHGFLVNLIDGRREARLFQIIATCDRPNICAEYLLDRMEKLNRDSYPYLLLCLHNCLTKSLASSVCENVIRLCYISVLRNIKDSRDIALMVLDRLIQTNIESIEFNSLDHQIEVLMAFVESKETKEPNLRFLALILTYMENRFRLEYWTEVGKKMFCGLLDWISSYSPSLFPLNYIKRLIELPFSDYISSGPIWNIVLKGQVPSEFDLEIIGRLISLHNLNLKDAEEVSKLLGKFVSDHCNGPREHFNTLTLIDSVHFSPFNGKCFVVEALAFLQNLLSRVGVQKVEESLLLTDARKYLVKKIGQLDCYQFGSFVEMVDSLSGIEEHCSRYSEDTLKTQYDPYFHNIALQTCIKSIDCPFPSSISNLSALVLKIIKIGRICVTPDQLIALSKVVPDKASLLELCLVVDIDLLHTIVDNEDLLKEKLISLASNSFSLTIAHWCDSEFFAERGSLFLEILENRVVRSSVDEFIFAWTYSNEGLAKLIPAVALRCIECGKDVDELPFDLERCLSPLLVRHLEVIPDGYIEFSGFVLYADILMSGDQLPNDLKPDVYLVAAYLLYLGTETSLAALSKIARFSDSDMLLVYIQLCHLLNILPFEVLTILNAFGTLPSHKTFYPPTTFAADMIYRTALSLKLPKDIKTMAVSTILKQIDSNRQLRIGDLNNSLPYMVTLLAPGQLSPDSFLSVIEPLIRVYHGGQDSIDSKLLNVVLSLLDRCEDDRLFLHISSCCEYLVKHDVRFKEILRARPNVAIPFEIVMPDEDLKAVGLVEKMLTVALKSEDPSVFASFLKWVLLHKRAISIEGLMEIDKRLYDFVSSSSEPNLLHSDGHSNPLKKSPGSEFFSHLFNIPLLNNADSIQTEVYYQAFINLHKDAEQATKILDELKKLPSNIATKALIRIVSFSVKYADIFIHFHPTLMELFDVFRPSMDEQSQAYCIEALRLNTGDELEKLFEASAESFKRFDKYWSFDPEPEIASMLKSNFGGGSEICLETIILGVTWSEAKVPPQLVSYSDRLIYSQARLNIPMDCTTDPFVSFSTKLRHSTYGSKLSIEWFDKCIATENIDKIRLVKMTDQIGRLYKDPACTFAAGLLGCKILRNSFGKEYEAIGIVKSLTRWNRDALREINPILLSLGLSKVGKWLESAKAAVPKEILEEYLEPAYRLAPHGSRAHCKALYRLAWFLDRQYTELDRSDLLQAKAEIIRFSKQQLDLIRSASMVGRTGKDKQVIERNRVLIESQLSIDQDEYNRLIRDKTGYLVRLLEYYLRVLVLSNEHDLVVFRFCSLWFAAKDDDLAAINDRIASILPSVPSHKFLPVMYQLAAKYQTLHPSSKMFTLLTSLLKRLLHKHPYHSIMQFVALSHGHIAHSGSKRHVDSLNDKPDINNARDLLNALKSTKSASEIIRAVELVANAYIELAEMEVDQSTLTRNGHSVIQMPRNLAINKLANTRVPILTKHLEPNPEGNYSKAVTLYSVESSFKVIGGINLPKILDIVGSDGRKYRQLVKGRDDLRQDAVVEQVFRLVNRMLQKHPKPSVAPLRTYRVVPLHQRAGVLEWVTESLPIGDYLVGAHERYHPNDWTPSYARQVARNEADRPGSTFSSKLQMFHEISAHVRPVFHYFFLERFLSMDLWTSARAHYQLSCASTSMMGYVIGLGDRHCQNIVIDCRTGQLIHIDLNMIFEQGRTLRVPERVPFRLTADVRDAMGPFGVEHGFRKSSIDFMTEIRGQAEEVLMVLEVFKHDPLHHWPTSLFANNQNNNNGSNSNNNSDNVEGFDRLSDLQSPTSSIFHHPQQSTTAHNTARFDMADRALLRVREKVSGREEGAQVSVAAQVNHLIQQATSPELLSQMYAGWQPWL